GYVAQTGLLATSTTNKEVENSGPPPIPDARLQLEPKFDWRTTGPDSPTLMLTPPCGLKVEAKGTGTRIVFPYSKTALVAGVTVAAVAGLVGTGITVL